MKNLLLLLLLASISCNSDDDDREECVNRLWSLTQNCDDTGANCAYFASFGETAASAGGVMTTAATYEYYTALGNTNDGSVCWEGTKD